MISDNKYKDLDDEFLKQFIDCVKDRTFCSSKKAIKLMNLEPTHKNISKAGRAFRYLEWIPFSSTKSTGSRTWENTNKSK